jgi:hypothetical protein
MTPVLTRETPHRRKLRRSATPVTPRRVSGPLAGRRAAPAPPRRRVRTASTPARAIAFVRGLPEHRLLDRLLRGRAWIPVLGLLLAGIVALQVSMLKLGSSIGRSVELGASLQSQNEQLRASVASLADDQRIERLAAGMGMVMAAPQAIAFLSPKPEGGASQAAANLKAPDSSAFLAALQASSAPAPGTSTGPGSASASASTSASYVSPSSSSSAIPAAGTGPGSAGG